MRKTLLILGLTFALRPAIARAADPSLYAIPTPPPIPLGVTAPYSNGPDLCVRPDLQAHLTELLLWTKHYPELCADIIAAREKHADAIKANALDAAAAAHAAELKAAEDKIPAWFVYPVTVTVAVIGGYLLGKALP